MKKQPNLLMTLSTPCSAALTHTGCLFLKYNLSSCIVVMSKIPLMIHQLLTNSNHHRLDLRCFFFFNVNNKTIRYPCREGADGAEGSPITFPGLCSTGLWHCSEPLSESFLAWDTAPRFWGVSLSFSVCCLTWQHQSQIPFFSPIPGLDGFRIAAELSGI